MGFDVKSFRRALGCFATGITVVTMAATESRSAFGITINSFTSLSLEPPLILFCLEQSARHFPCFHLGCEFAVNVLQEDQEPLSAQFATPVRQHDWSSLETTLTARETPLLVGCLAHVVCTLAAIQDGGDHGIMVGHVRQVIFQEKGRPLLYFRGRYDRLDPSAA